MNSVSIAPEETLGLATATLRDERGATAVEYGLMVALIAVAIIVAVTAVGDQLVALFNNAQLHMALN